MLVGAVISFLVQRVSCLDYRDSRKVCTIDMANALGTWQRHGAAGGEWVRASALASWTLIAPPNVLWIPASNQVNKEASPALHLSSAGGLRSLQRFRFRWSVSTQIWRASSLCGRFGRNMLEVRGHQVAKSWRLSAQAIEPTKRYQW